MEAPPESKHALTIGSPRNQDSNHENPVERYRQTTDRVWIFIFPIIIIAWAIICILGFVADHTASFYRFNSRLLIYLSYFNAPILSFSFKFISSLVVSIVVVCLSSLLTNKFARFFVNIGLGLYMLSVVGYTIQSLLQMKNVLMLIGKISLPGYVYFGVVWSWVIVFYMITVAVSYLKADKSILSELVKDTCGTIFRNPSLVIFATVITISLSVVISFMVNAIVYDVYALRNLSLNDFYFYMIIIGGMFAVSFIILFAFTVISESAVNDYWNKNEKSSSVLGRSLGDTIRNHIGTVMFASSTFVSFVCAVYQAFKHKRTWRHKDNAIFYHVSKILLTFRMSEIAVIFSSIYGTSFNKSMQTSFDVILRRPILFLATLAASDIVFIIVPTILWTIGAIILTFAFGIARNFETIEGYTGMALLIHGLIYPLICFTLLTAATSRALFVNKIIMLNKEDDETEAKIRILHHA